MCHLCGYVGQTRPLSIMKNGYGFLRHLPPAPGALPINDNTQYIRACYLCALLLDKQRELNHTTNTFFFKGFFRSTGSSHMNVGSSSKIVSIPTDEREESMGKYKYQVITKFSIEIFILEKEASSEEIPVLLNLQSIPTETEKSIQQKLRTIPPPLRKTNTSNENR